MRSLVLGRPALTVDSAVGGRALCGMSTAVSVTAVLGAMGTIKQCLGGAQGSGRAFPGLGTDPDRLSRSLGLQPPPLVWSHPETVPHHDGPMLADPSSLSFRVE